MVILTTFFMSVCFFLIVCLQFKYAIRLHLPRKYLNGLIEHNHKETSLVRIPRVESMPAFVVCAGRCFSRLQTSSVCGVACGQLCHNGFKKSREITFKFTYIFCFTKKNNIFYFTE